LPDGNGLEYLTKFKEVSSSPEVIIITGNGDQDGAEKAIISGAWAYLEKLNVVKDLLLHITRALQYQKERKRVQKVPLILQRDSIIGNSSLLTKCLDQVAQAAVSDASVLITGETGTGKNFLPGPSMRTVNAETKILSQLTVLLFRKILSKVSSLAM